MVDFALHFVMVIRSVGTLRTKIARDLRMDGGR
jgi:hypothetical protein